MVRRSYAGGAAPLVLSGTIDADDTNISTTGTATGWPTGGGGKFLVVIDRGLATEEKVLVNSRSGNTLTLLSTGDRGQDNTSAATHLSGAAVEHVVGAIDLDEPNEHINDPTEDHHTQYMKADGVRHDLASRHLFGVTFGTPATPAAVSETAAAAGSGSTPARDDHVHLLPAAIPRGYLAGSAAKTTMETLTLSQADVAGLTVTATTVASRRYRVAANVRIAAWSEASPSTYPGLVEVFLVADGTTVNKYAFHTNHLYLSETHTVFLEYVTTPTAASHTYKIQARYADGSQAGQAGGTADIPGRIYIEDIGI